MLQLRLASTVAVFLTGFTLTAPLAPAQTASGDFRFDAASLKPLPLPPMSVAPSGEQIISERVVQTNGNAPADPGLLSPGRIHYVVTLRELLANAYQVKESQVQGPAWIETDRFVLDATMPPETTRDQRRAMLQNLVQDRFQLTSHRETRELPMFSLVVSKSGARLKESPNPASATMRTANASGSVRIAAQAQTMSALADQLALHLDRPVKDETGMQEKYDFELNFSSDPGAPDQPDIFSAIQTQLGLKLEARKGPVELIVIDRAERIPAQN